MVHRDPAVTLPLTARSRRDEVERRDHAAAANDRRTGRRMRRRTRSTVRGSPRHRAHDSRRPPTALRRACSGGSAVREALTVGASPGSGGGRDVEWFHINRLCDPLGRHSRHSESRMLVMWWVWRFRGPYEPEFGELSRDRPGSRQNRDKIGPRPGISRSRMCPTLGLEGGAGRQPRGRIRSTFTAVSVPPQAARMDAGLTAPSSPVR